MCVLNRRALSHSACPSLSLLSPSNYTAHFREKSGGGECCSLHQLFAPVVLEGGALWHRLSHTPVHTRLYVKLGLDVVCGLKNICRCWILYNMWHKLTECYFIFPISFLLLQICFFYAFLLHKVIGECKTYSQSCLSTLCVLNNIIYYIIKCISII